MNSIQCNVAKGIFALDVTRVANDSSRHALQILPDLGGKHICHVALEVCASNCSGVTSGNGIDEEGTVVILEENLFVVTRNVRVGR